MEIFNMEQEKLKRHDTVGIIAPCYVVKEHQYDEMIKGIESLGYQVVLGRNIYKNTYGYSASELERADDFNFMVNTEEIKMILFGGGFVGSEIIPYIDFGSIRRNPKMFSSYSDGTTILNAIYSQTGLVTYYGQRPATFANIKEYNKDSFARNFVLENIQEFMKNSEWDSICPGTAEGILIGGYLENFSFLLGNKYFSYKNDEKYVLFLEDYYEFSQPSRISMYLSYIEQSAFIRNVSGLLFGHYADTENTELRSRLYRFGKKYEIPVVYCDDYGHGINNGILQIGRRALLDSNAKSLKYISLR
jgi:muramoyltetrapeptide carboxypeptidase